MYADYIVSHGGQLPESISNEALLIEFERLSALSEREATSAGKSAPTATEPVFSSLSIYSRRMMDTLLAEGVALPERISNSSIENAFFMGLKSQQLQEKNMRIKEYLAEIGHPLPAVVTSESLENEMKIVRAL